LRDLQLLEEIAKSMRGANIGELPQTSSFSTSRFSREQGFILKTLQI